MYKPERSDKDRATVTPTPPAHFVGDDLLMWDKIWDIASAYVQESDYFAVQLACELFVQKEYLRRKIATSGEAPIIMANNNKTPMRNPLYAELRETNKDLMTALSALGLTPSSRSKIGSVNTVADDLLTLLSDRRHGAVRKSDGKADSGDLNV